MTPFVVVVGTRNAKKGREIEALLHLDRLQLRTMDEFPNAPEVDETGSTFLENASLKATTLSKILNQWVLGEDSGLCVDALGGDPGIYSARFAGEPRDDERNNDLLLKRLQGLPEERRSAHYVCAAVLADPTGAIRAKALGKCHGRILAERRGQGGFGYDPLFLIPAKGLTFGQLSADFKNAHSHRAMAMKELRPQLERIIASESGQFSDR